jgi:drug/metabolite transporter (DMT)-like permease
VIFYNPGDRSTLSVCNIILGYFSGGERTMWIILALTAAFCFGIRGILFLKTATYGLDRNQMMLGVFLSGVVCSGLLALWSGQSWENVWGIGSMMGITSIAANVFMFQGFAVGKPTVIALLSAMPPALVVVLAYVLWGETLTVLQLWAFLCIFVGVLIVRSTHRIRWHDLQGAQWGALACISFACTDLLGKQSTRMEAALFPTLTVLFAVGTLYFALIVWWRHRNAHDAERTPALPSDGKIRTVTIGMGIGLTNVGGMVSIVSAFSLGVTGLVSAVVALNILLIVVYSRLVGIERWRLIESVGMLTSLAGVVSLQLLG